VSSFLKVREHWCSLRFNAAPPASFSYGLAGLQNLNGWRPGKLCKEGTGLTRFRIEKEVSCCRCFRCCGQQVFTTLAMLGFAIYQEAPLRRCSAG
jgi:hypothetical protein